MTYTTYETVADGLSRQRFISKSDIQSNYLIIFVSEGDFTVDSNEH